MPHTMVNGAPIPAADSCQLPYGKSPTSAVPSAISSKMNNRQVSGKRRGKPNVGNWVASRRFERLASMAAIAFFRPKAVRQESTRMQTFRLQRIDRWLPPALPAKH